MSAERYEERVKVTRTNKDRQLLDQEDGTSVWLPQPTIESLEVRLLDGAGTVGTVAPERSRAKDGQYLPRPLLRLRYATDAHVHAGTRRSPRQAPVAPTAA